MQRAGQGCCDRQREGQNTDLSSTHNPQRNSGQAKGAERRTHKPHNIEGGLVSWNKCTQAPWFRGQVQGAKASEHKPWEAEGELRGAEESPHKSLRHFSRSGSWEKTHKTPTWKALACSAGWGWGTKALAKIPGTSREGAGASEDMLREPLRRSCGSRCV